MNRQVPSERCGEPFLSGTFSIAAGHPALAGHFPGNPIVPGVTVLRQVLKLLEPALPEFRAVLLRDVKFLRPLRAGETCSLEVARNGPLTLAFVCRVDRVTVARGALILDRPDS